MYTFITASKDASVYLLQPYQNTGLDQILEIGKTYYGGVKEISRVLLQFDVTPILNNITTGSSYNKAELIMTDCESDEIPLDYIIYANAVSQSWEMGSGTKFDNISTSGVSWRFRDGDSSLKWVGSGSFEVGTTGSYAGYGGTWYTAFEASQSYSYDEANINMDVTNLVTAWISGSIPNNGIILRHSLNNEDNTSDYGIIKLYGKETHTIHQPKLRVSWNDSVFSTGSLSALTSENIKVIVTDLKPYYIEGTVAKIRILGRENYPLKTFTNPFPYKDVYYLPRTTYYQIRDVLTDDIIIPYSTYSTVSCDSTGNYITVDFSNWEVGRQYELQFKTILNGTTQYFNNNIIFGVEK